LDQESNGWDSKMLVNTHAEDFHNSSRGTGLKQMLSHNDILSSQLRQIDVKIEERKAN